MPRETPPPTRTARAQTPARHTAAPAAQPPSPPQTDVVPATRRSSLSGVAPPACARVYTRVCWCRRTFTFMHTYHRHGQHSPTQRTNLTQTNGPLKRPMPTLQRGPRLWRFPCFQLPAVDLSATRARPGFAPRIPTAAYYPKYIRYEYIICNIAKHGLLFTSGFWQLSTTHPIVSHQSSPAAFARRSPYQSINQWSSQSHTRAEEKPHPSATSGVANPASRSDTGLMGGCKSQL